MNRNDKPDAMTLNHEPAGTDVHRYADAAMYRSEEMPVGVDGVVRPRVYLLNATPDPFGSLAALNGMYGGRVRRSLREVTDAEREEAWAEVRKNVLGNGPMEAVQFHFFVEGVTRAFTHQAVRSRASFFAQESLRFAVAEGQPWHRRVAYPPSLAAEPVPSHHRFGSADPSDWDDNPKYGPEEHDYALKRDAWDNAVIEAQNSYQALIDAGVPAEDARGLMPHSMTTRYHWICDLRTLLAEAGKRLCTQAQFEWRAVFAEVVKALRDWGHGGKCNNCQTGVTCSPTWDAWQFAEIADALRPLCFQEGHCGFMSKFDRGCKIRERVSANAEIGRSSIEWSERYLDPDPLYDESGTCTPAVARNRAERPVFIGAIGTQEWLTDPSAARIPGFGETK